ncbi:uncharacterized protein BDV17DRAFT_26836 [Aspergillus undulatus]|uniref:uncharacterized protein n=1 Tax=Aspergillus undulatus TaxID=1810928 RepID=UPI003CCCE509
MSARLMGPWRRRAWINRGSMELSHASSLSILSSGVLRPVDAPTTCAEVRHAPRAYDFAGSWEYYIAALWALADAPRNGKGAYA